MVAAMSEALKSRKILKTKEEIQTYIGGVSGPAGDVLFKKYIEAGMPARFEDGRWIAHADNIDEFFRRYTLISMKNNPKAL